jgi:NAD(P)-dependent dehydrogenase (short-subunit alcohol dehydrogenase family)
MADRNALVRCDDVGIAGAVAGRLTADGVRVTVVPGTAAPDDAVAAAVVDSGVLDVLVCAGGQPDPAPFVGADPARWYADVMTHLTPAFALARAAAPALRRSGPGGWCSWAAAGRRPTARTRRPPPRCRGRSSR